MLEWLQFITGLLFLLIGMAIFLIQIFGVYKFKYILNRMHAAAMGDTLGIGLFLTGLMILNGFCFASLKIALIIVFLWCTSPVSSHLICRLEFTVNPHLPRQCELSEQAEAYLEAEHQIHADAAKEESQ